VGGTPLILPLASAVAFNCDDDRILVLAFDDDTSRLVHAKMEDVVQLTNNKTEVIFMVRFFVVVTKTVVFDWRCCRKQRYDLVPGSWFALNHGRDETFQREFPGTRRAPLVFLVLFTTTMMMMNQG
jgi:hypothetical protein